MKQHNLSFTSLVAVVAALAGLIFYLGTTLTGYLTGSVPNPAVVICSVLAILLLAVLAADRVSGGVRDLMILAAGFLLIVGVMIFALERTSLAADIYFIPVNYPAAEETAFQLSVVGAAGYLAALLADMVTAFSPDKN